MRAKTPDIPKPENHERWIVTYADMLTLLFALFVVLWSMSDPNTTKIKQVRTSLDKAFNVGVLSGATGSSPLFDSGGGLTPSIAEIRGRDLAAISKVVGDFSNKNALDNGIQIRSDADSITISLSDNLLFDSGRADLRPGSQTVLDQVAGALKALPNEIRVEGHTDNVPVNSPDFATNWELSAARASTVLRYLTESAGLKQSRLFLAGYADTRPVADNSTPEGRALNRRADIVIVYPTQQDLEKSLSPAEKK
jgi:chemotaxis protein MotB